MVDTGDELISFGSPCKAPVADIPEAASAAAVTAGVTRSIAGEASGIATSGASGATVGEVACGWNADVIASVAGVKVSGTSATGAAASTGVGKYDSRGFGVAACGAIEKPFAAEARLPCSLATGVWATGVCVGACGAGAG